MGETWTLKCSNDYHSGAWTLAQQLYGNGLWGGKYDYDAQTDDLLRRYRPLDNTGFGIRLYHDSRGQVSKIEKNLTLEKQRDNGRNARDGRNTTAMTPLLDAHRRDGRDESHSDIAWSYDANTECRAATTRKQRWYLPDRYIRLLRAMTTAQPIRHMAAFGIT